MKMIIAAIILTMLTYSGYVFARGVGMGMDMGMSTGSGTGGSFLSGLFTFKDTGGISFKNTGGISFKDF